MKKLKWGQTPFHKMTKKELKSNAIKFYDALVSCQSVLHIMSQQQPGHLFWSGEGSGGRALKKATQSIKPIEDQYDSEKIYRCFYRYTTNLLFDSIDDYDWYICDVDGFMVGLKTDSDKKCPSCSAITRPLTLYDLENYSKEGYAKQ